MVQCAPGYLTKDEFGSTGCFSCSVRTAVYVVFFIQSLGSFLHCCVSIMSWETNEFVTKKRHRLHCERFLMYLSLTICSISFGAVSLYFLVYKEGTYDKIFPLFVFAGSMAFVSTNKFSCLLLKSLPRTNKNTYVGQQQIICSNPSLFLRFQCVYFVIMNIPSAFVGHGIDDMLLAFGLVFAVAVLEKGCLNVSVQIHLLQKLKEAQQANSSHSTKTHSSRIRQLRLVVAAFVFLLFVAEFSCGLFAVWRRIQFPPKLFSLLIGCLSNFTIHSLIITFPPKNKRAALKNMLSRWAEYKKKRLSRALQDTHSNKHRIAYQTKKLSSLAQESQPEKQRIVRVCIAPVLDKTRCSVLCND